MLKEKQAVKAIVVKKDEGNVYFYYQVKRNPRKFRTDYKMKDDIPGGKVEAGETPEEACIREVLEECGINCKVDRKISEWKSERPEFGDVLIGQTYLCAYVSGEPDIRAEEASEIESFCWRNVNDKKGLPQWILDDLKAAGF